jgi:hypothetical protein
MIIPLLPYSSPHWTAVLYQLKYSCQSQRVRVTLRLVVYRQSVCLGDKPLETHDQQFYFKLNPCGYGAYVTSSLMRGRVRRSLLLLVSPAQPFSLRVPRDSWPYFTVSNSRFPQRGKPGPRIISPKNRVARLYPRHWVPFSLHLTTRRATVELFDSATILASIVLLITLLHGPRRKYRFQQYLYCCMRIRCRRNLFTEPLPRNGSGIFAFLAVVTW